jgi:hypothetical protein
LRSNASAAASFCPEAASPPNCAQRRALGVGERACEPRLVVEVAREVQPARGVGDERQGGIAAWRAHDARILEARAERRDVAVTGDRGERHAGVTRRHRHRHGVGGRACRIGGRDWRAAVACPPRDAPGERLGERVLGRVAFARRGAH